MGYSGKIMLFFSCLFFPVVLLSQTGDLKGIIYEEKTGEPIIFTSIYLYKTTYGATSDINGYFAIPKIPAGSYTLMVTTVGYDTIRMPIEIKQGESIFKKLYLKESTIILREVKISGKREEARTETRTSVVKITPKDINQIPTIGGTADIAQYLQVLPGVIFTGDQGGQLYIRGGPPVQNKVLLDGMIIYNPFHSIGLFSVFDTEIIKNADVYAGGFGAEYGDRISSVMDIRTRDGNKKRIAGKIGASPFGANLLLEGPLKKQKNPDDGCSSFIFSAKNSYLGETSKTFYNYIDTAGLPFNYQDLYGKISFSGDKGNKANFFGFNFNDKVNYRAVSDFHWNSQGMGTNFILVPSTTPMLIDGIFTYSKYKISFDQANSTPRTSEINGFNMGFNFSYFLGKNEVKYGIEMLGFKTDFNYYNSVDRKIQQTQYTTELGSYVKYKLTKDKFVFEPSIRLQYYASLYEISPEPRLAFKYNALGNLRFKVACGLYSQNLISANSDRDVVNLFYGFLSTPDNLAEDFQGKEIKTKLQKAQHIIVGMEYDITEDLSVNTEAYYKNMPRLININRNKIFDDIPLYADKPDELKKDFVIETGNAYGLDFTLKYDRNDLYIWAVYSLGYIYRDDGINTYIPHFDRRHNVNLLIVYNIGEKWEISTRWNYGSGFPFTKDQGFYELLNFSGGINTDYTISTGDIGVIYGDLNGGRLPAYHRLDLSVKRKFKISKNSVLNADFSIINVYNNENIFYFDRIKREQVNQLPFMPSIGLSMTF